jgi:glutathione S-transferase
LVYQEEPNNKSRSFEVKIYWFKAQAPQRVLALVKHLGINAELIEVDMMGGGLKTPEYSELNPNRKAPTLVDGDVTLWESCAIMAYLCIKTGSNMWPAQNPAEQVEVLRWLSWSDCHWSQAVAPFYFEHIVKSTFKFGTPDKELLKKETPNFLKFAKVLDTHLLDRNYVACNRLTIADFQMASMASYWRDSEMPIQELQNIVRWLANLDQNPAWAHPWPAESKYAKQ